MPALPVFKNASSPTKLLSITAQHLHISVEEIKSTSRNREAVEARQIVFKILKDEDGRKYAKIGMMFEKNHATIIHGVKSMSNLIKLYPPMKRRYDKIKEAYLAITKIPK